MALPQVILNHESDVVANMILKLDPAIYDPLSDVGTSEPTVSQIGNFLLYDAVSGGGTDPDGGSTDGIGAYDEINVPYDGSQGLTYEDIIL